jgi:ribosomal protein S18 acetylase RimI-like enzyme
MQARDLDFVTALHGEALPYGFFAKLGPAYLRTYHASFLASPYAITLLADLQGTPAGFVAGTIDSGAHYRFVLRHRGWRLAVVGLLALARRPRLATRFVRTRARQYAVGAMRLARPGPTTAPRPRTTTGAGVLAHVAVLRSRRGSGAGAALVEAFADQARARGVDRIRLSTRADESGAAPLYERLGWRRGATSIDFDGRPWVAYLLDL